MNLKLDSLLKTLGISKSEYEKIKKDLKKEPNNLELLIYSSLWSEHCSYKRSKHLLKELPTRASHVIQGPGENAGVIDIGIDKYALCLKIESHNHPSSVEPFYGSSTGVGGMLRDLLAMGSRPICVLNGLALGLEDKDKNLLNGIIDGISFYGNCIGVPTIGGAISFDECFNGKPLVNVMGIGLLRKKRMLKSVIPQKDSCILYVGRKTGSEGIGGAILSSQELGTAIEESTNSIQTGDPFIAKSLLEFCLNLVKKDILLGMQDLGAAGILGALSELAYSSHLGIRVFIDKIPAQTSDLSPSDLLISESQERMLIVIDPSKKEEVIELSSHYELECCEISEVLTEPVFEVVENDKTLCKIPLESLLNIDSIIPSFTREAKKVDSSFTKELLEEHSKFLFSIQEKDWNKTLNDFISQDSFLIFKDEIYKNFDSSIGTNTIIYPGDAGASVLRIKETDIKVACSLDYQSEYFKFDVEKATMSLIAKSLRNIICTGSKPLSIVDGLNFGNPEKKDVYFDFVDCINGIKKACRTFGIPVVSGNVSFYNEKNGKPILPSPMIGSVGILKGDKLPINSKFKQKEDLIFVIGNFVNEIYGSQFLKFKKYDIKNRHPFFDLEKEKEMQDFIYDLSQEMEIQSLSDISYGGLFISLIKSLKDQNLGALIQFPKSLENKLSLAAFLFSESQSRFLISIKKEQQSNFLNILKDSKINFYHLGTVTQKAVLELESLFKFELK